MEADHAALDDTALEGEIRGLNATLDAGQYRLVSLLAEFEARALWAGEGHRSCAHWLSVHLGIAPGAAREQLRVGRALRSLPKVAEAFASGALSYSKARAITRIADTDNEDFLLSIAQYGSASHLERLVTRFRGAQDAAARFAERVRGAEIIDRRSLYWSFDDDGQVFVRARLPPEQGAVVIEALNNAVERLEADRRSDPEDPHPDVSAETSPEHHARTHADRMDARRADALVLIAEEALASGGREDRRTGSDRHHVTVVIDATTLAGGDAGDAAECHVPDGPTLPLDTVRRLCCDGAVSGLLERHERVLSVGRRTRAIPPSMRRALLRRDGGCRFPGCTAHRFVDGHHIRHWAEGGETALDNLVLLCTHHHRLVHEGGFTVEPDAAGFTFRTPAGRTVGASPEHVSAETPLPRVAPAGWGWDGTPMDWSEAVEALQRTARDP